MFLKKKFNNKNYLSIVIFFFALLINQFSGNRGVFPIDSFSHFDTGYRILVGDMPFRDYWVVSGPLVDFLQAFIFLITGVNWQNYLLNASILNGIVAVLSYRLFLSFKLNQIFSFFYAICFAILAYPLSGTPFVDLHSVHFSIISVYLYIFAIRTEKLKYWFLLPIFLLFAFLSKQVPAAYIGFSIFLLIIYEFVLNKKVKNFSIFFTLAKSTSLFLILISIFFYLNSINLQIFFDQYINYPREIGGNRIFNTNYNFKNTILDFKFIHIIFLLLLVLNSRNFFKNKNFYKEKKFKIFLISLFLFLSLIQHQILTKNQEFIFFLIPLFSALVHIDLFDFKHKYKKYLIYFLLSFCLFTTFKYHLRYNLEKKFHELDRVSFENTVKGEVIDKKFKGLNWITPGKKTQEEVEAEIKSIKEIYEILKNDNQKKMLFTNYSFFSVLLEDSVNSTSRWFPGDDSAFPIKESKFYNNYKNFLLNLIKSKKIIHFYVISDINEKNLLDYLPLECLDKVKVHNDLLKFKINDKCQYLYGKL